MKWYYTVAGGHIHVRVFMNGGKCGDLCFRNEEFEQLKRTMVGTAFISDEGHTTTVEKIHCPALKPRDGESIDQMMDRLNQEGEIVTVGFDRSDRDSVILAIAKLAVERPGWKEMLTKIAEKLDDRGTFEHYYTEIPKAAYARIANG